MLRQHYRIIPGVHEQLHKFCSTQAWRLRTIYVVDGIGQDRAGRWGSEEFAEGDLAGRKAGNPGTLNRPSGFLSWAV